MKITIDEVSLNRVFQKWETQRRAAPEKFLPLAQCQEMGSEELAFKNSRTFLDFLREVEPGAIVE